MKNPFPNCLVAVLLLAYCTYFSGAIANLESDEFALLQFKTLITSDPQNILAKNWSTGTPTCQWTGVVCNRKQRVAAVHLSGLGLSGIISPSLGNLTFLASLDISDNHFTGQIPGALPAEIGNLTQLKTLGLASISLTGQIPSFLFNISSLKRLDLNNNSLSGNLPVDLSYDLHGLEELYIRNNQLVGPISTKIYGFTNLQKLEVSENQLTGSLPREFGNLTFLKFLDIHTNNLTASRQWNFKMTTELLAQGFIQSSSDYSLFTKGGLPAELGGLELEVINLHGNSLSGFIPYEIFNISTLKIIDLNSNHLSGHLPSSFGVRLPELEELYLGENQLKGFIPSSISNASKLSTIYITSNNFTGSLPNLGNLRQLRRLLAAENNITGNLKFLSSLENCGYLEMIDVSFNQFNGALPNSLGNLSTSLKRFTAFGCGIRGVIPTSIGNLTGLTEISLDSNQLTGFIPSTLGKLVHLERIYLEYNRLQGHIPTHLCKLSIRCIECNSIMEVVDSNMIREGDEYFAIKAECVLSICGLAMACLRDSPQQRINTREIVGTLQQLRTSYLAKVRSLPEKSRNLPMLRSFTTGKSP
nr:probable LRR receptor-like serine/threonine-protein kinase At3g47570 [Ipomoea batatas]